MVKPVIAEVDDVFRRSVNSAKETLRRLMGYMPIEKEAIPRELLETMTLNKGDILRVQRFFEGEYHNSEKQLTKDLITDIESWVIQRLDERFSSNEEVNLMQFLIELNEEQTRFYDKWNTQRMKIEKELLCEEDLTDYLAEDLEKVNSLALPDKIREKDRMTLATLYRIRQKEDSEIVFASTDYAIVLARSVIEPNLGFFVSDPLYVMQKLQ